MSEAVMKEAKKAEEAVKAFDTFKSKLTELGFNLAVCCLDDGESVQHINSVSMTEQTLYLNTTYPRKSNSRRIN